MIYTVRAFVAVVLSLMAGVAAADRSLESFRLTPAESKVIDAVKRVGQGVRTKDVRRFFSSVYIEDVDGGDMEANFDLLNLLFRKMVGDADTARYLGFMADPVILGLVKTEDGVVVKFAPKEVEARKEMKKDNLAGIQVTVVYDKGWKVDLTTLRPILDRGFLLRSND